MKGDTVYVASQDNIVRALDREQRQPALEAVRRHAPVLPPRVFERRRDGRRRHQRSRRSAPTTARRSTWAAPADALLQGPPLIAEPAPLRVAIVVVFRDGQVIGLRPTEMLFKEPALVPLTTLPGRPLPRER